MPRLPRFVALLSLVATAGMPAPALAAGEPTVFGVISSTRGEREPDTAANFIRLYGIQRDRYDAPIGIRLFSAGALPLPGDRSMGGKILDWALRAHPEEVITVSHKTRDDVRLRKFLDWVGKHGLRASVIYYHEAQPHWFKDGRPAAEPSTYRAVYRAYREVIDSHPAKPRVTLEKNLMWYWQRYKTGPEKRGDWRLYVDHNDPADLLSRDTYTFPGVPPRQEHYSTPDDFFRYARDAWKDYGLAWGVGEIGTAVQDGTGSDRARDPDGSRFAARVRQITAAAANPPSIGPAYAGMPPARFVKWWCALDADGHELGLEQVPAAVTTYRNLIHHPRP